MDKYNIKNLIAKTVLVFLFLLFSACAPTLGELKLRESEKVIGRQIKLDNDTFTIIDYNLWDDVYVVSNGLKIGYSSINKFLLNDTINDKRRSNILN
jgi:hypothetical protein